MTILYYLLTSIYLITCVLIIIAVLFQESSSGGLGGLLGGSTQAFGAYTNKALSNATKYMAIFCLIMIIVLNRLAGPTTQSIMTDVKPDKKAPVKEAPAENTQKQAPPENKEPVTE